LYFVTFEININTLFSHRKLFVGGIHAETSEGELRTHFEKFGRVQNVVLKFTQPVPDSGHGHGAPNPRPRY